MKNIVYKSIAAFSPILIAISSLTTTVFAANTADVL